MHIENTVNKGGGMERERRRRSKENMKKMLGKLNPQKMKCMKFSKYC